MSQRQVMSQRHITFLAVVAVLAVLLTVGGAEKIRGYVARENERDLQFFSGLLMQLAAFARALVGFIVSLPTTVFRFIFTILAYLWDIFIGILLFWSSSSGSSRFTTATTTATAIPTSLISSSLMTTVTADPSSTTAASSSAVPTNPTTSLTASPVTTAVTADPSSTTAASSSVVPTNPSTSLGTSPATTTVTADPTTTEALSSSTGVTTTSTSPASTTTSTSTTSTTTPRPPKYAFLSSAQYPGNLGGIQAYDDKCAELVANTGNDNISGTYLAWMSDGLESPSTRFTQSTVPYILVNNMEIAANYMALVQSGPSVTLNINEDGEVQDGFYAWTGTNSDGTADDLNCANWTSSAAVGRVGRVAQSFWSSDQNVGCAGNNRIYCFQQ